MMSEQRVPGSLSASYLGGRHVQVRGQLSLHIQSLSTAPANTFGLRVNTWATQSTLKNEPGRRSAQALRGVLGCLGQVFLGPCVPSGGIEEKHTCPSVPWTLFACVVGYCQEETRAGPSNAWGPGQRSLLPRSEGHSGPKRSSKTRYIVAPCELPNLISPSAPATRTLLSSDYSLLRCSFPDILSSLLTAFRSLSKCSLFREAFLYSTI